MGCAGRPRRLRRDPCAQPLCFGGLHGRGPLVHGLRVVLPARPAPGSLLCGRVRHCSPHRHQASYEYPAPDRWHGSPLRRQNACMSRITVLGSGAWGTAIALSLHRRGGHQVALWAHSPALAQQIAGAKENTQFLPGIPLPADLIVTGNWDVITAADILVSVIPSEFLRPTMLRIRAYLRTGQFVVSATKGLEDRTLCRMTQVLSASLESAGLLLSIGALSGPSFALEVAQGQPTAVTVAFSDAQISALIQQEFSSETLRLYTSADVVGVELGGALKNVIAIAAGVSTGMGLGHNS